MILGPFILHLIFFLLLSYNFKNKFFTIIGTVNVRIVIKVNYVHDFQLICLIISVVLNVVNSIVSESQMKSWWVRINSTRGICWKTSSVKWFRACIFIRTNETHRWTLEQFETLHRLSIVLVCNLRRQEPCEQPQYKYQFRHPWK